MNSRPPGPAGCPIDRVAGGVTWARSSAMSCFGSDASNSASTGFTNCEAMRVRRQSATTCAAVSRVPSEATKNPVPATAEPGLCWVGACVSG